MFKNILIVKKGPCYKFTYFYFCRSVILKRTTHRNSATMLNKTALLNKATVANPPAAAPCRIGAAAGGIDG